MNTTVLRKIWPTGDLESYDWAMPYNWGRLSIKQDWLAVAMIIQFSYFCKPREQVTIGLVLYLSAL